MRESKRNGKREREDADSNRIHGQCHRGQFSVQLVEDSHGAVSVFDVLAVSL